MEDTDERGPNVLLMLAMSLGLWGLLCLGIASAWPRQVGNPDIAGREAVPVPSMQGHAMPQLVSLGEQPLLQRPTRTRVKVARNRRWGPTLAARVFKVATSVH